MRYYENDHPENPIIQIHIADIHFGAIDPEVQYTILVEQFLDPISRIHFDVLSIDGDLFDKKFLASAPAITYAMRFVLDCAELCMRNYATMIILSGTESHDAGQLSMFRGLEDSYNGCLDIRIIEHIQFEYIKGLKTLCIPEEYGKPAEYYTEYLCDVYDMVFMHGTIQGAVYGANKYNLESKKAPVFSIEAFSGCRGPIIAGHVHKAMCLSGYMYYVSNPIRYKFGEEEPKGYSIVLVSPTKQHYYQFMPIESFRYDTIDITTIEHSDPNAIIQYLDALKANGIDHIRIDFSKLNDPNTQAFLEKYYASDANVVIKRYNNSESPEINTTEEIKDRYSEMDFLINPEIDSLTKFVMFINHNEGKQTITVDQLKSVLSRKSI